MRYSEIVLGLCSSYTRLNSLPGWTSASWGYHGDDGDRYSDNAGTSYGETFGTGDIIGCKVGLHNDVIFTKNGTSLGRRRDILFTYGRAYSYLLRSCISHRFR
jgi:SPRY domain